MDERDFSLFKKNKNPKDDKDSTVASETISGEEKKVDKVSILTDTNVYVSSHVNLGVALIFNHKRVEGQPTRNGTGRDRDRLKKVLRSYGFDVRVYDDLEYTEIKDIINSVSDEDHSDSDCLFVSVMSHGIPGCVFAKDRPYPVEELWQPFLGNKCKSLVNKPKLFFIQACRGEQFDDGVQFMARGRSLSLFGQTDSSGTQITYTIPTTADLLIMYSTFEGNYSWRNSTNGSWFIQSLCIELEKAEENSKSIELYYLLTSVARRVAYDYQSNVPADENMDQMKQMPSFVSTLTKVFYLTKKD